MKYATELESIHFDDQSLFAENGVIEGEIPQRLVELFNLKLIDEESQSEEVKKEPAKRGGRKTKAE